MEPLYGVLDLLVLRTLLFGPLHGYAIATAIRSSSGEALNIEFGSLYPALKRLELKGLDQREVGDVRAQPARPRLSADARRPQAPASGNDGMVGLRPRRGARAEVAGRRRSANDAVETTRLPAALAPPRGGTGHRRTRFGRSPTMAQPGELGNLDASPPRTPAPSWAGRGSNRSARTCATPCAPRGRSPIFTVAAIAVARHRHRRQRALFSLINTMLWKSLPVRDPETLLVVGRQDEPA